MNTLHIGIISDWDAAHEKRITANENLAKTAKKIEVKTKITWITTDSLETPEARWELSNYDALIEVADKTFLKHENAVAAVRVARLCDIPFIGCGEGFITTIVDFARNVCVMPDAGSQTWDVDCPIPVIISGETGTADRNSSVIIKRGSKIASAYRRSKVEEPVIGDYRLNPEYVDTLEIPGMYVTGRSETGEPVIVECNHWYYIALRFIPVLGENVHPLVSKLLLEAAALKRVKTGEGGKPETINNRWDVLYRLYPDVYNRLNGDSNNDKWLDIVREVVPLKGKVVVDIGAGSGSSSIPLAKYAKEVLAIEPEEAMSDIAREMAEKQGVRNIKFIQGKAASIPLPDDSADVTISVTGAFFYDAASTEKYLKEAERVTVPGGYIITVGLAPKWGAGGEYTHLIMGKHRVNEIDPGYFGPIDKAGHSFRDYYDVRNLGSVQEMLDVVGFLYGKKVIDYIRKHNRTTVKFKYRVYYKQV